MMNGSAKLTMNPEYCNGTFSELDPYVKLIHSPSKLPALFIQTDSIGNIHVRNISAYWVPQITFQKEIRGTVYTVTGSYEGADDFIRKLERMRMDKIRRVMEGDIDDK